MCVDTDSSLVHEQGGLLMNKLMVERGVKERSHCLPAEYRASVDFQEGFECHSFTNTLHYMRVLCWHSDIYAQSQAG